MAAVDTEVLATVIQLPSLLTVLLKLKYHEKHDKRISSISISLLLSMNLTYPCFAICLNSAYYTPPSHSPSSTFVTFCSLPCFFCFQFSDVKCFKCEIIYTKLRFFRRTMTIYVPLPYVCAWVCMCVWLWYMSHSNNSHNNIVGNLK